MNCSSWLPNEKQYLADGVLRYAARKFASDERLDLAKVDGAGQSVDNGRFRSNEQESAFDADCFRFLD
jgi:hypothetical protein